MAQAREMTVNMGPQHPSTHGVLRLLVTLDGETVTRAIPEIGYLHRCYEQMAEGHTFTQAIAYTDRTDYLGAITNEWALVLAVEKLMGLELPPRAEWIRVMAAEMQRITSHLIAFGTFALDTGATTPFLYAFREREKLYDFFERLSGGRLLYNYFRIGGVRNDLPVGFKENLLEFLDYLEKKAVPEYHKLLSNNRIFQVRTQKIGVISKDLAIAYGATGPVARGSGVDWDLRRDDPYGVYDQLEIRPIVRSEGDAFARYMVRMDELSESIKLTREALHRMPDGEYMARMPKVIKPPAGEVYTRVEGPRGEVGCYLVSDGGVHPYRNHWRAPSFIHLQLIPEVAPGLKVADLVILVGSIDIVLGEVDR